MNLTIKIGRLTSDPELRYTNSGKAVASFNIAVRKKFKQEGQKDADFFKCVVWNKSAEYLSKNMKKGGRVAVVGR
ncbi:single-stranded DNA-binding protein, partial [Staphylococcus aureus]|uniref:single-stranded DNA-binding protein n=1 Tax=Staphylococcus aureus TaxID=1280 RepID=UPI00203DBE2B